MQLFRVVSAAVVAAVMAGGLVIAQPVSQVGGPRELPPAEQAAARAAAHNGAVPAIDGARGHRFALELQRRWVAQQGDPGARP